MAAEDWLTKMKNKSAMGWEFVAVTLAVLVTLIIILMFQARLGEIYNNLINKNTCKSSIRTQDLLTVKNIALPADIKCPLQRIDIEEKDPDKIKQKFAKLYYDVCDEFGQGTLNLFGKRETTFCVVRDKITFKNKNIKVEDFAKYLAETKIPGKDLTYSEFCSGFETERIKQLYENLKFEQVKDTPIDTSKEYTIIFFYAKGEEQTRGFLSLVFGTSEYHVGQYVGVGVAIVGYGLTATGEGSIIGLPLVYAGNTMFAGGAATAGLSAFLNYLTNKNLKMEWVSFFLIREFDEQELKKLPCKYLPAEQY